MGPVLALTTAGAGGGAQHCRVTTLPQLTKRTRVLSACMQVLAMPGEDEDPFDPEIETIIKLLGPRLEGIEQVGGCS